MKKLYLFTVLVCFLTLSFYGCSTTATLPLNADMTPDREGNWEINNYVDDYGTDTDSLFMQTSFTGYFSNSATTGSNCTGLFRINDVSKVEIVIYEYDSYRASGFGYDDKYNLTIWDADTDEVLLKGSSYLFDDRFVITDEVQEIVNALSTTETLKVRLSGGKYTTSTYVFIFDTKGFASDWQIMMNS